MRFHRFEGAKEVAVDGDSRLPKFLSVGRELVDRRFLGDGSCFFL